MKRGTSKVASSGKPIKMNKSRNSVEKKVDSMELDDMNIPDLELEVQDLGTELIDEIEDDELSEITDSIDQDYMVNVVSDLLEKDNEESSGVQELTSYPEHKPERAVTSGNRRGAKKDMAENTSYENWETDQKPRVRWLMTTCLYCGDMYRFRSDQPQSPTCGNPRCIEKFEERMKRKLAIV